MKKLLILFLILLVLTLSACEKNSELIGSTAFSDKQLTEAETRADVAEMQLDELEKQIIDLNEQLKLSEKLASAANSDLLEQALQLDDLRELLVRAEMRAKAADDAFAYISDAGFSDPAILNQNVIVENPPKNLVTFEIDEKLVGKYIVEDDPEMYFEIKSDGKAEISLNALSGYALVRSEYIQLTAYYSDHRIIVNFNLVSGNWTFPGSTGLSVSFEGDPSCTSFISTVYWPEYQMKFVKQD
ncbi:MAG: hypothetical protein FWH57_10570 [Oscillospiraceae bacterium]|nr:hypothetical protein [Oscillospiraceae bacterium]